MRWFHPLGGPVLLLPTPLAPKWRGQHPQTGFTRFYDAVVAGLGDDFWVGLDIGGVALADRGPIGIQALDEGGLRLVIAAQQTTQDKAEAAGAAAEVSDAGKLVPWPGGAGLLFDAVENGATLDGGLTEPAEVQLPEGPLAVRIGQVAQDGLDLCVVELVSASG